jgi:hypothetical protein
MLARSHLLRFFQHFWREVRRVTTPQIVVTALLAVAA